MKKTMLVLIAAGITMLVLIAAGILLSACNTMNGFGQDMQGAGEWTSQSAEKVKDKMNSSSSSGSQSQ